MKVLCRTLQRTFLLGGPLPEDCSAFLHANPLLPSPTQRTETIQITPRGDGLFSLRASWGSNVAGSARSLARSIDEAIFRIAAADEHLSPSLNATVLRIAGIRVVLATEVNVDYFQLVISLLMAGAAFEGTGLVFLRRGGIVAHPAKPRLRLHCLAAVGLSASHSAVAALELGKDDVFSAIDPRMAGVEWKVMEGPAQALLLIERNESGHSAMARLGAELALARLMRSLRVMRRPNVEDFAQLRALVESAKLFRCTIGDAIEAASMINAQLHHLRVDD